MGNCPTESHIVLLYGSKAVTPELSARILKERINMLWHKHLVRISGLKTNLKTNMYHAGKNHY